MNKTTFAVISGSLVVCFAGLPACGSSGSGGHAASGGSGGSSASGGSGGSGGSSATGGSSASGGAAGSAGSTGNAGAGGSSGSGGSAGSGGAGGSGGSPTTWKAGSPGTCTGGVPALGKPAATSNPTTVVGTGTAASCTFAKLNAAVTKGGVITFNCGKSPVTIAVTATMNVPTTKNTVIDGGRLVTLDGQNSVQILNFNSANWQANTHRLTLQHLRFINAKTNPTQKIPTRPAPCSQGYDDGQGGALFMRDGNLSVVDCIFKNDHAAPLGPDTGGGAIYVEGSKNGVVIADSTFDTNDASNAGAVGGLFAELDIYDSVFTGNKGTGHDANNADQSQCSYQNNGQYEIGSGGNGGAIYSDGNSVDVNLCGDKILNNAAGQNAFGGGLFFTSNNMQGNLTIVDTTMTGNTGGHWTNVATGSVTNAGTAVGTNCHSITIQNSTLQGVP